MDGRRRRFSCIGFLAFEIAVCVKHCNDRKHMIFQASQSMTGKINLSYSGKKMSSSGLPRRTSAVDSSFFSI